MSNKHTRPPVKGEEGFGLYQWICEQEAEAEKEAYTNHCVNMHNELLEALEGMVMRYYYDNGSVPEMKAAKKAIKKARGE